MKIMRLGAFEVQLFKKESGRFIEKTLHSKLQAGYWPNVSAILEKIHFFLPRIPKLTIQLFRDLNSFAEDDSTELADSQLNFKDLQITLKSTYQGTTS
jgi:hypothetical protein